MPTSDTLDARLASAFEFLVQQFDLLKNQKPARALDEAMAAAEAILGEIAVQEAERQHPLPSFDIGLNNRLVDLMEETRRFLSSGYDPLNGHRRGSQDDSFTMAKAISILTHCRQTDIVSRIRALRAAHSGLTLSCSKRAVVVFENMLIGKEVEMAVEPCLKDTN